MPVVHHLFPEEKLVIIKGTARFAVKDIMTAGSQVFTNPLWQNGFKILIDYRAATRCSPSADEMRLLIMQDKTLRPKFDKSLCAIVVPNNLLFGIARMWQLMSMDNIVTSHVFKELRQALDWLGINAEDFERLDKQG